MLIIFAIEGCVVSLSSRSLPESDAVIVVPRSFL